MTRRMIVLAIVVLMGASCGSDEGDGGIASLEDTAGVTTIAAEDPDVETEEAMLAFTECLREQGLEADDPEFDNEGEFRLNLPLGEFMERMNRDGSREAFEVCQHLLAGVTQRFTGFDRTAMEDRLVEYAECMRENGYDMPDPDLGGSTESGPGSFGAFGDLDTDDPAFQSANVVCQPIFAGTFTPDEGP